MLPPPPFIINWPNNWDRLRTLQKDQVSYAEVSLFLEKRWIWIRCGEKKNRKKFFTFDIFSLYLFFPLMEYNTRWGRKYSTSPSSHQLWCYLVPSRISPWWTGEAAGHSFLLSSSPGWLKKHSKRCVQVTVHLSLERVFSFWDFCFYVLQKYTES